MSNIFTLENVADFSEKINIDALFDKKQKHDLNKLELYNKLLNRIHVRIKTTSRQKIDEQFCWFVVPELIIGVPKYDQPACIAYLISKLRDNQFNVRYIHPNTLFISWLHWVPSYVRTELKKKTGIVVNEYGQKIDETEQNTKQITNESKNMLAYNPKGPVTMSNDSQIYIDCQPVGQSDDSEIVVNSTGTTNPITAADTLNNPVVQFFLGSLIFIVFIMGIYKLLDAFKVTRVAAQSGGAIYHGQKGIAWISSLII